EAQGRVVVSVGKKNIDAFVDFMKGQSLPCVQIGNVTESDILIDRESFGKTADIKKIYDTAIEKIMEK
ncbi:MAG: hypothetical protein LBH30_01690, partial [Prevotellaceae bacterium]|nr:hypothetical protein [Prevotellaceae bacterium]